MNKTVYEPYLDNLKAILIFLVVLGHFLEIRISSYSSVRTVFSLIYAFHMPLFVFISGYLSKTAIDAGKLLKNLLLPYLVFNSLWYLLAMFTLSGTAFRWFYPGMSFWYLLSLFIWRLLLPLLAQIRYILPISILAGITAGCFSEFSFFLAASRTVSFLPFFLLGYFCSADQLKAIRIPKISALFIIAIAVTIIYLAPAAFPLVKPGFFYADNSFSVLKISNLFGIIFRSAFYLLALTISLAVLSLTPNKENRLTFIGRNSLYIYIFHTYLLFVFKNNVRNFEDWFVQIAIWLIPVILTIVLGTKPCKKLYSAIINPLYKLISIKQP